jgi:hypothetical protein
VRDFAFASAEAKSKCSAAAALFLIGFLFAIGAFFAAAARLTRLLVSIKLATLFAAVVPLWALIGTAIAGDTFKDAVVAPGFTRGAG